MRIRRSLPILLVVVLVAAVLTLIVQLRKHAPPEAARLLPGGDGFLYLDLQWMRRANVTGDLPKVPHDPEYEQFIQATGFQFERDLDEAAFAIHYPPEGKGKTRAPDQPRFSEIFIGKFQGEKLSSYLRKLSSTVDDYHSIEIFNIPLEGRTLRVAILGVDTVAASNQNDPQVIRGMIERSRKLASPFAGPSFLRQYYKDVPFTSLGWSIFRVQPSSEVIPSSLNLSMLFSKPAVVVASVRYLGSVHFKAEAFTGSEEEAKQVSDKLSSFLNIFRTAEISVASPGPDLDVKHFFESLTVEQHGDRAVLNAIVPTDLIKKMVAASPEQFTAEPPAPEPTPPPTKKKKAAVK
jgi:hypothetical protein